MKMWAKYYDIPIVILDGNIIYNNAMNKLKKDKELIKNGVLSLELFEDMIHRITTIKDVKGETIISPTEILDILLNESYTKMSAQNIETINNIVNKYPIEAICKNTSDKEEKINNYKQKINYLNQAYNELMLLEENNNKLSK